MTSAIERCRTAALSGHVAQCPDCGHSEIAYNSCSNRHCPTCQGAVAKQWLAACEADLLPVEYYHVVFTLPAPIAQLAYTNKAVVYGLLFQAAAETLLTIAADPKHLGAHIGVTAVLHPWGSALTYPSVRVLSRLFRRLFCKKLAAPYQAAERMCVGEHEESRLSSRMTAPRVAAVKSR